jgi:hypothetical protein
LTKYYPISIVYPFYQPFAEMKHFFLILLICLFSTETFGQNRIGFDISARQLSPNFTLNLHHVFKSKFLLSVGVFAGGNGVKYIERDTNFLKNGGILQSPYDNVNQPYFDTTGNRYNLVAYETQGSSAGISLGLGVFHAINEKHSIRGHIFAKFSQAYSNVKSFYYSQDINTFYREYRWKYHFIGSVSLEAFHSIRISTRGAFYYGVKVPFYFSLQKSAFNPKSMNDLFFGFQPELSVGMTFAIGKCD